MQDKFADASSHHQVQEEQIHQITFSVATHKINERQLHLEYEVGSWFAFRSTFTKFTGKQSWQSPSLRRVGTAGCKILLIWGRHLLKEEEQRCILFKYGAAARNRGSGVQALHLADGRGQGRPLHATCLSSAEQITALPKSSLGR